MPVIWESGNRLRQSNMRLTDWTLVIGLYTPFRCAPNSSEIMMMSTSLCGIIIEMKCSLSSEVSSISSRYSDHLNGHRFCYQFHSVDHFFQTRTSVCIGIISTDGRLFFWFQRLDMARQLLVHTTLHRSALYSLVASSTP